MTREFRVGDWLVEPDLNRISMADKVISIEPKILEVLVFLAEQPGEVLPARTIIRGVWPDTFVSDDVLTHSISEIRKALGDDAKNPHIIQTIPRKGYRLVAPVTRQASPSLQSRPSIAVMAFSDMSPEKDQEYFCDGIAEELVNNLSHVKGLHVAARTSAFAFKGKSEDVRTIGRSLGVATRSIGLMLISFGVVLFCSTWATSPNCWPRLVSTTTTSPTFSSAMLVASKW